MKSVNKLCTLQYRNRRNILEDMNQRKVAYICDVGRICTLTLVADNPNYQGSKLLVDSSDVLCRKSICSVIPGLSDNNTNIRAYDTAILFRHLLSLFFTTLCASNCSNALQILLKVVDITFKHANRSESLRLVDDIISLLTLSIQEARVNEPQSQQILLWVSCVVLSLFPVLKVNNIDVCSEQLDNFFEIGSTSIALYSYAFFSCAADEKEYLVAIENTASLQSLTNISVKYLIRNFDRLQSISADGSATSLRPGVSSIYITLLLSLTAIGQSSILKEMTEELVSKAISLCPHPKLLLSQCCITAAFVDELSRCDSVSESYVYNILRLIASTPDTSPRDNRRDSNYMIVMLLCSAVDLVGTYSTDLTKNDVVLKSQTEIFANHLVLVMDAMNIMSVSFTDVFAVLLPEIPKSNDEDYDDFHEGTDDERTSRPRSPISDGATRLSSSSWLSAVLFNLFAPKHFDELKMWIGALFEDRPDAVEWFFFNLVDYIQKPWLRDLLVRLGHESVDTACRDALVTFETVLIDLNGNIGIQSIHQKHLKTLMNKARAVINEIEHKSIQPVKMLHKVFPPLAQWCVDSALFTRLCVICDEIETKILNIKNIESSSLVDVLSLVHAAVVSEKTVDDAQRYITIRVINTLAWSADGAISLAARRLVCRPPVDYFSVLGVTEQESLYRSTKTRRGLHRISMSRPEAAHRRHLDCKASTLRNLSQDIEPASAIERMGALRIELMMNKLGSRFDILQQQHPSVLVPDLVSCTHALLHAVASSVDIDIARQQNGDAVWIATSLDTSIVDVVASVRHLVLPGVIFTSLRWHLRLQGDGRSKEELLSALKYCVAVIDILRTCFNVDAARTCMCSIFEPSLIAEMFKATITKDSNETCDLCVTFFHALVNYCISILVADHPPLESALCAIPLLALTHLIGIDDDSVTVAALALISRTLSLDDNLGVRETQTYSFRTPNTSLSSQEEIVTEESIDFIALRGGRLLATLKFSSRIDSSAMSYQFDICYCNTAASNNDCSLHLLLSFEALWNLVNQTSFDDSIYLASFLSYYGTYVHLLEPLLYGHKRLAWLIDVLSKKYSDSQQMQPCERRCLLAAVRWESGELELEAMKIGLRAEATEYTCVLTVVAAAVSVAKQPLILARDLFECLTMGSLGKTTMSSRSGCDVWSHILRAVTALEVIASQLNIENVDFIFKQRIVVVLVMYVKAVVAVKQSSNDDDDRVSLITFYFNSSDYSSSDDYNERSATIRRCEEVFRSVCRTLCKMALPQLSLSSRTPASSSISIRSVSANVSLRPSAFRSFIRFAWLEIVGATISSNESTTNAHTLIAIDLAVSLAFSGHQQAGPSTCRDTLASAIKSTTIIAYPSSGRVTPRLGETGIIRARAAVLTTPRSDNEVAEISKASKKQRKKVKEGTAVKSTSTRLTRASIARVASTVSPSTDPLAASVAEMGLMGIFGVQKRSDGHGTDGCSNGNEQQSEDCMIPHLPISLEENKKKTTGKKDSDEQFFSLKADDFHALDPRIGDEESVATFQANLNHDKSKVAVETWQETKALLNKFAW